MRFYRRDKEVLTLNLTPLIDVVFLLLIFFIATTTFTQQTRLEVQLPHMQTRQSLNDNQSLQIYVNAQGQIAVEDTVIANPQAKTLREAMQAHAKFNPQNTLVLNADGMAPHQMVVRVMDVAGNLGYSDIQIRGELD